MIEEQEPPPESSGASLGVVSRVSEMVPARAAELLEWATVLEDLERRKERARQMGGAEAIARLRDRGKLTARERITLLVDAGTFEEFGVLATSQIETVGRDTQMVPADGVVTGWARVGGRLVCIAADDATVAGGARGTAAQGKIERLRRIAVEARCPMISLLEASAARIQDSLGSQFAKGGGGFIDELNASGTIPRVVALMGGGFGQPSFLAMMSDFRPIVKGSAFMGMSGPPVVEGGTGERVTAEQLGGSHFQTATTGQADIEAESEGECIELIKTFLSFLPSSCFELPPTRVTADPKDRRPEELLSIVPLNLRRAYDMRKVVRCIVDNGEFFELKPTYARNLLTGFARLGGEPVGIIANQPMFYAGAVDRHAAFKAAHFVDMCDAFHVPLVFFVDVPGFLVGTQIEQDKTLTEAIRFVSAVSEATVPKFTVILRKAYGLAYVALGGRGMNPELLVAWPSASISMMGPEAGVKVVHAKALNAADNPEELAASLRADYLGTSLPNTAAERYFIDDIIDPRDTRRLLIESIHTLGRKRIAQLGRKHPIQP